MPRILSSGVASEIKDLLIGMHTCRKPMLMRISMERTKVGKVVDSLKRLNDNPVRGSEQRGTTV